MLDIDESPTKEGRHKSWLWAFVAGPCTVWAVRSTRAPAALKERLTAPLAGMVNCDRAKMCWRIVRPQWCWVHLKPDFQALIDHSDHQVEHLGRDLRHPAPAASGPGPVEAARLEDARRCLQDFPRGTDHGLCLPFLPFADDDLPAAKVLSKVTLLARDHKIQDPSILEQLLA